MAAVFWKQTSVLLIKFIELVIDNLNAKLTKI